jgi:Cu+-exporting ATPase
MTKKIIFQDTFLIIGIMCHLPDTGCGASLERTINTCLTQLLPHDVEFNIDAEPKATGSHYLTIKIEGQTDLSDTKKQHISTTLKSSIENSGYSVLDDTKDNQDNQSDYTNWINMVVNLVAISAISSLSVIFPPSLLLTIGLTTLSVLTTAFTARTYLISFFENLPHIHFTSMPTTITLGWVLSVAHTLYHSIKMPLASSFSMVFMSFIMPIVLITVLNGMDEIKRLVLNKSKKLHLQGIKALFPQMSKEYDTYPQEHQAQLSELLSALEAPESHLHRRLLSFIQLNHPTSVPQEKNSLKKGMVINIKRGECFPVDCILINEDTVVDASLLTGEPRQNKKCLEFIPAGAINLGPSVHVIAKENAYNSSVNKLLFRSNRATDNPTSKSTPSFSYLYSVLVLLGIMASILVPLALGITSVPLLLQNIIGVIFAVCPCTIAIAHQLPNLLSTYQRGNKGILLRDDHLTDDPHDIHTIVFDKTGTLTTGNSQVESSINITSAVWERISLLEESHGAEHPLANAITNYYKENKTNDRLFNDVHELIIDPKNRGLSGIVQGIHVHIGNAAFLAEQQITLPPELSEQISEKLQQGFSPVYVAEKGVYQGVIFIKHEVRKDVLSALSQLKDAGKNIIMLTGDNSESAKGFNEQNGGIFEVQHIHTGQTPEMKESFLKELMNRTTPEGVWFVGDGLNDAPCARIVSEKKGVSCAMTSDDKAAFFTDISLNGSLDYLLQHHQLNQFLKKNIMQNQGLLIYSLVAYLAFIVTFSIVGIAVSPLIPLTIMLSTTLFTLFNSYRVQLSIDNALDKNYSGIKQLLASDLSFALPLGASMLLICGIFISTVSM